MRHDLWRRGFLAGMTLMAIGTVIRELAGSQPVERPATLGGLLGALIVAFLWAVFASTETEAEKIQQRLSENHRQAPVYRRPDAEVGDGSE